MEPENTCCTCYYHDAKSWFCYNGLSPKGTENTDPEDTCEFYEKRSECESLHHFDVVNYIEDPPVRPCWGKCYGILKEGYYDCHICGYMTNWQPETCPVCHTRLEMWDGKR